VSNDDFTNTYDISSASVVHFYRDIIISSSTSSTLSFDIKCYGQASNAGLRVYLCEDSFTPVVGTLPIGTYLDGYSQFNSWQSRSITIPPPTVNSRKRLVFTWVNNGYGGYNPPAAVDNIVYNGVPLSPVLHLNTTSHNFGSLVVNTVSQEETFAIVNIGSADLNVNTITLTGNNVNDYILTVSDLPATIIPASYKTFTVSFSPSSAGNKSASIVITTNAGSSNISLTGEGYILSFNPPQNLTATAGHQPNGVSQVVLSWQAPQVGISGTLAGYKVYRGGALYTTSNIPAGTLTYTDTNVVNGTAYTYTVRAVYTNPIGESQDSNAETVTPQPSSDADEVSTITKNDLFKNYPNLFNPTTTLTYDLVREGNVSIIIYNSKGQRVKTLVDGVRNGGRHTVVWNRQDDMGRAVGSGVYFYRMVTGDFVSVKKMVLMK